MQLLFATHNQGKIKEARQLLNHPNLEILSAAELPDIAAFDVDETGTTFAENAELKARAFGEKSGILTASDDSGLEVAALGGKPGVLSKRFFPGTDQEKNSALLELLQDETDRRAQFKTVICLYHPQTRATHFFEGIVTGNIADQIKGNQGFGYDPIFIPDGYSQTFGQLGTEVKNTLSHRAHALQKLQAFLLDQ